MYLQIAEIITKRIESGELAPRRPIPSESDMVKDYAVSRDTARRVHEHLRDLGLIYTVPRRGSFVSPQQPPQV